MTEPMQRPAAERGESSRVAQAHARAAERLSRQRDTLRPLGWAVIAVVVAGVFGGTPRPSLAGRGLGVTLCVVAFSAAMAVAIDAGFPRRSGAVQAVVIATMGAAGVAVTALQPRGATALAGGAAVWMAVARLAPAPGVVLGVAITLALDIAAALAGASAAAVLATTLLCALLGLVAYFMRRARQSQDHTELLLAELQDAREEQTRAAALAERGRIASELHDVLAHSLSGAAIQLQGARLLAERERAQPQVRLAIDRASQLVKEGLASARQAVGALRGEQLPGPEQLEALVQSFRADMGLAVTLSVEGTGRRLPADAGLALYRGAQEALTNVARYAPGATTSVVLRYEPRHTTLSVEDRLPAPAGMVAEQAGLSDVGGGRGLAGLRERLERAGGTMRAGPTADGWRVDLAIPA